DPPPPRGDHGTTYPIPNLANNSQVVSTTGLPDPAKYNLRLDTAWLYETAQRDDFSRGLEDWSAFGIRGVDLAPHPTKPGRRVLQVRKTDAGWPSGAVWNFPSGAAGRVRLRLLAKPGFSGARIGLTDHFSVPFDELDRF